MEEISETSIQSGADSPAPQSSQGTGAAKGRRRRGAQPGNHNALKHGMYSRATRSDTLGDLDLRSATYAYSGLQAEVEMLHTLIRRMFAMADGVESMEEMIEALRAVGMASTRLAVLLRTQRILVGGQDSQAMDLLIQALAEIMEELKRKQAESAG